MVWHGSNSAKNGAARIFNHRISTNTQVIGDGAVQHTTLSNSFVSLDGTPKRFTQLLDNKALNRSVHSVEDGQVVGWSYLPLYPTTVFTTSNLFDTSVNAGVIQLEFSNATSQLGIRTSPTSR
ncbi:hypothetical protein MFFC18_21470 [Mariniblastus fucicola]|uniref:Uncharacterized protein n=1 Tax=Mariniblastus fucicola TaxID=980251 RepID=A0A5B9PHD2_9BACT|nr:hypothetical protein MFFC18_21470 [Mariniblastus fucicola]